MSASWPPEAAPLPAGQDSQPLAHFDLLIVGGGMVGATLACALRRACPTAPRLLLVEAARVEAAGAAAQPGFDARSTALSLGSVRYLEEMGLWGELQAQASPIKHIHVSEQGRFGSVRMHAVEQGVEALGQVLENAWLGRAFNSALRSTPGLEIRDRTRVLSVGHDGPRMRVELEDEGGRTQVSADLVVLAEGGRSGLLDSLGFHRRERRYEQVALVANVCFERPHEHWAWERFTPDGPLALLPLPDFGGEPRAALVWTQPEDRADELLGCSEGLFRAALQRAFGQRLGRFRRIGQRYSFPLSLLRAEEQVRPGIVLLGNAANALHPVAGQGFNLALRNTLVLAEEAARALRQGESPGNTAVLQRYLERAVPDQDRTVLFSDTLTRLFGSRQPPLVLARALGLFGIDTLPIVKRRFVERAMGLGERRVRW